MTELKKTEARGAGTPKAPGSGPQGRDLGANDTAAKPYAVYAIKHDGARYLFQRYATLAEAQGIAKTLCSVGCQAAAEAAP
jgi:hypothetical protein